LLTIAVGVNALASHCDDVEHFQHHLDGVSASAELVVSSPGAEHDEPCDHCAFCTGGVEEPTSLLVRCSLAVESHSLANSPDARSVISPTTYRPPRS
jgi:hypothetical protein